MPVKAIEKSAEKYILNSTKAFLQGEQSFEWITGVLPHSGLSKEETNRVLFPLGNHRNTYRSNVLFNWLAQADW